MRGRIAKSLATKKLLAFCKTLAHKSVRGLVTLRTSKALRALYKETVAAVARIGRPIDAPSVGQQNQRRADPRASA